MASLNIATQLSPRKIIPSGPKGQSQTRPSWGNQFSLPLNSYVPLKFNLDVYDILREAIPFLDVAVLKYCRLIGDFNPQTYGNGGLYEEITKFKNEVRVNDFENGLSAVVQQITGSAIAKGMGFVETIVNDQMTEIERLRIAKANDFRFVPKDGELKLGYMKDNNFQPVILNDFVQYLAFDLRDGHPQGYSMFYSLPFVAQTFLRIQKAIDNHVWRMGDPTFYIFVTGGDEDFDYEAAKLAAAALREEVTTVMKDRRNGKVGDLHGAIPPGGKVEIGVLGGGISLGNLEFEMRSCTEQIISRTGFPPFIFSLYKWSSTERMSTNQADMIVAEINSMRSKVTPIIRKIINTHLLTKNKTNQVYDLEWERVNLLDKVEEARMRYANAQAQEKELNNLLTVIDRGMITDPQQVTDYLSEIGLPAKRINEVIAKILSQKREKNLARKIIDQLIEENAK